MSMFVCQLSAASDRRWSLHKLDWDLYLHSKASWFIVNDLFISDPFVWKKEWRLACVELRWLGGRSDDTGVIGPEFPSTARMWQRQQNHTENSGPSAHEQRRRTCLVASLTILTSLTAYTSPTPPPSRQVRDLMKMQHWNMQKITNFVQILEKRNMLSFFGWQKFECAVKRQRGPAVWTNWHGSVDNLATSLFELKNK